MKKLFLILIIFSIVPTFADLGDIQTEKVFTATKRDLKALVGARVLCTNDLRIACYAFHFKPWELLDNPGMSAIAGYGSEPKSVLSKIEVKGECKAVRGISRDQVQVEQNGENYIEFRAGVIERTKVINLVRGSSYVTNLNCDVSKLYEDDSWIPRH